MTAKALIQAKKKGSLREIAAILGITTRRVRQLVNMGRIPEAEKRGSYNLIECTRAYSEYQRKQIRALRARKISWLRPKEKPASNEGNTQLQEILNRELREMASKIKSIKQQKKPEITLDLSVLK